MKEVTQYKQVLNYLHRYPTLSQREAAKYFGIYRLASVVHVLKRRGNDIGTQLVPWNGSHYARYFLNNKTN